MNSMTLSECELKVVGAVERRRDELVALASDLIHFDTTARAPEDPPRQEAALQNYLADRLRGVGATVDLWEPEPDVLAGIRHIPPGLTFEGRPQLLARFAGSGGGPSLLFNGHIDVVPSYPRDRWATDPNKAEERNGLLYGRGSCDMKGGIAAMLLAAEALAQEGIQLVGDLLVNTVTDEESSGAGGIAAVAHGVRADAGIIPEPTGFDVWIVCRGAMTATITVPGRPGHAEIAQPHWRAGGAVNAIEKSSLVLDALGRLRDDWRGRSDRQHPCLSAGGLVPTLISGGEWLVTYPASCRLDVAVTYVPNQADAEGWGTLVEQEVSEWIQAAARSDPGS